MNGILATAAQQRQQQIRSTLIQQPELSTAQLTITDDGGASDTAYVSINITDPSNQSPTAIAGANPTSGAAPLTVSFSSNGSSDPDGSITGYLWDFDDGNQSTAANPSHIFASQGQYNVMLTVTDDDGATGTDEVVVDVSDPPNQPPVAYIDAPDQEGVYPVNQAITYSGHATDNEDGDLGASAFTWSVILPNGQTYPLASGQKSGIGVPVSTGTHELILQVEDSGGLQDETSITFTVSSSTAKRISGTKTYGKNAAFWGEEPSTTKLFNSYPNPFNPETTIRFELGTTARVHVQIYDVLGTKVAHPIRDQVLAPGRYTIKWQARNEYGQWLPSGIYFINVQAGEYNQRHRLLFLK